MKECEEEKNGETLEEVEDGAGCVEIWEKLSRKRREERVSDD
jgi:hypothetical protein